MRVRKLRRDTPVTASSQDKPRVTMRDVAEMVGVSPMTVSRAFRSDKTVSERTRQKVREAATQLGYVYDSTATAFRTQKSGFVALTLPSLNNANFAETYRGLTDVMPSAQMQLLLGATGYRVEKEEELVRQLLTRNPEALVMTGGHHSDETTELARSLRRPVIEMWDLPSEPIGHAVGFSNAKAMALIVAHLAETGRKKLAFLGATGRSDHRGAARRDGVVSAARDHGLAEVTCFDLGVAPVAMRQGAETVRKLGRDLLTFDALVCVSDTVAFGALNECRRLGISVPADISITGFGFFDIAAVSQPSITTVDVGARRIGEEVAHILDLLFSGEPAPRHIDVGAKFVQGETS